MHEGVLFRVATAIYGFASYDGLIRYPGDASGVATAAYLLVSTYGIGLARSWKLFGGHRTDLLTRLILRKRNNVGDDIVSHVPTTTDTII